MKSNVRKVAVPLPEDTVRMLRTGDEVLISGTVYTARDMAHARLADMISRGMDLPFDMEGSVIYYTGPSPAPPGRVIGSAGPTTSYRMDMFAEAMFKAGMKGMIGKGARSPEVKGLIRRYCGIYFAATGGAAALLSDSVIESDVVAFEDLGPEAVRRLVVRDMPVIVVNDCFGGDLYSEGIEKYGIPGV